MIPPFSRHLGAIFQALAVGVDSFLSLKTSRQAIQITPKPPWRGVFAFFSLSMTGDLSVSSPFPPASPQKPVKHWGADPSLFLEARADLGNRFIASHPLFRLPFVFHSTVFRVSYTFLAGSPPLLLFHPKYG